MREGYNERIRDMHSFTLRNSKMFWVSVASIAALPLFTSAAYSNISITRDGNAVLQDIRLIQKSGSAIFFSRAEWDNTFLRLTILPQDSTKIYTSRGDLTDISNVSEGDTLDVEGTLTLSEGTPQIKATSITDKSLAVAGKNLSGQVQSVDTTTNSFTMLSKQYGTTRVYVSATTTIQKGILDKKLGDISIGDTITSAMGAFNYETNVLQAATIYVYQDPGVFVAHNFQGTLNSKSGDTLPASIVVATKTGTYTVYLAANTTVLNNAKQSTSLSRFQPGDTVRFYGAARKTDLTAVDAEVLRDLSF